MNLLAERIASDDAPGAGAIGATHERCAAVGSYRYDGGEWDLNEDDAEPDRPRAGLSGSDTHRPYFETLFVTPLQSQSRKLPGRYAACGAPRTR